MAKKSAPPLPPISSDPAPPYPDPAMDRSGAVFWDPVALTRRWMRILTSAEAKVLSDPRVVTVDLSVDHHGVTVWGRFEDDHDGHQLSTKIVISEHLLWRLADSACGVRAGLYVMDRLVAGYVHDTFESRRQEWIEKKRYELSIHVLQGVRMYVVGSAGFEGFARNVLGVQDGTRVISFERMEF